MSRVPGMCFFCERNFFARKELKKGLDNYDFDWRKVIVSCEAYPDGIPKEIFLSGHLYPKPNDGGLQFQGDNPFGSSLLTRTQEKEDKSYYDIKQYLEEQLMSSEEYYSKFGKEKPHRWLEDIDYVLDS